MRALEPAFLVDAAAGVLLGANAGGWRALGLEPEATAPPIVLDRAMPALHRLRQIAVAGSSPCAAGRANQERLIFWTPRGIQVLFCLVETDEDGLLSVTVEGNPRERAPVAFNGGHAPRHPGLPSAVGRDAWLAHELRTPLSAVIAYAEILKDEHFGPLGSARYRGYARDIYDGARHALGVVDSILRGDPSDQPAALAFCDLDPAGIVESCLAVVRPLAERAGLQMEATCAPRLPRVVADELTLKQMLLNLLANAIKFARPGDRVTVAAAYDGAGPLVLSVADTGPGMASGASCGKAAEPAATGLGLGLPLSRALAAANGASIDIASEPGRGTCVTITFAADRVVPV
jgi:signal transduction histidine kinase